MAKRPEDPSEKDLLDIRLKIVALEHQTTEAKRQSQREDLRGLIDSYRKLTQGALLINSGAMLVLLNAWVNLSGVFGRPTLTAMLWCFSVGVVLGLSAHFVAIVQTATSLEKAIDNIDPRRWWAFYASGASFIAGIGIGLFRLTWT